MEKVQGYEEAQAITGEYERLNAGGYICKIVSAKEEKSKSGKRMLVLALDIIEGDKKDFFRNRFIEFYFQVQLCYTFFIMPQLERNFNSFH